MFFSKEKEEKMKMLTPTEYDDIISLVYVSLPRKCSSIRKFELYLKAVLGTNYQLQITNIYISRLILHMQGKII